MRQKLGVIAAMLTSPALLVLDEPTTGVDPVSRADLWSLIARAAADGAAVVVATSYLDEAERAAPCSCWTRAASSRSGTPDQIVAAMPGQLRVSDTAAAGRRPAAGLAPGRPVAGLGSGPGRRSGQPVRPDLQDAVTVAILGRELAAAGWDGER